MWDVICKYLAGFSFHYLFKIAECADTDEVHSGTYNRTSHLPQIHNKDHGRNYIQNHITEPTRGEREKWLCRVVVTIFAPKLERVNLVHNAH